MAVTVTVNGVTFTIPQFREQGWASQVTAWVQAISASSGAITNSNVAANAGIVYSKLNLTNSIINADINSAAAIAYSKLSLATSILNADISASAAIAYSKLVLTNSVVNADIATAAAIAYSKLTLTGSVVNADVSASAAIAYSKLANLTSAHILVGSAGNVPTDTAVTGDVTIGNTGVTAIGTKKVLATMLGSGAATSGQFATADGSGGVTYTTSSVAVDNTSIDVNGSSQLEVKAAGITSAKLANNLSLPGKNTQVAGQDIVVSANPGTNGLLIIRGTFHWSGSAMIIDSGEGFSVTRSALGLYIITYTAAFLDVPAVSVCSTAGNGGYINGMTTGTVTVTTVGEASSTNGASFIAIGQRA